MKKNHLIAFWMILALPLAAIAQPMEEEISTDSTTYEIEVIESPSAQPMVPTTLGQPTTNEVNTFEPIGESLEPAPKPQAQEISTDSGSSLSFAPRLGIRAVGYNGYEKETYGRFSPGFDLSTDFPTSNNKPISLGLDYTFVWDEFYDKSRGTDRYFEHDANASLGYGISDLWSANLGLGFNYSLRANPNDREFTVISTNALTFTYKATTDLSVTFGYGAQFWIFPDGAIFSSDLGIPGDIDDVRQGDITFDDGFAIGADDELIDPQSYFINNSAKVKLAYRIPKGPKIVLDYSGIFETFNNNPSLDWNGHIITLGLSQSAWEGGTVSIKNNLRLRNYQAKTIDSGALRKDQRNRTDISVSQKINDNISVTAWYRLQLTSFNGTAEWTPANFWFLGTNFGF